jgi:hypothetical protein
MAFGSGPATSSAPTSWPADSLYSRSRPSLKARWQSFWAPDKLDQALAAGADPLSSDGLLWRAQQLTEPGQRLTFADTIELIVGEVRHGGPQMLAGPALTRRDVVRDNQSLLLVLAARLRDDGPHGLRGLAMVDLLVGYRDSTLYQGPSALQLKWSLLEVLARLDVGGC